MKNVSVKIQTLNTTSVFSSQYTSTFIQTGSDSEFLNTILESIHDYCKVSTAVLPDMDNIKHNSEKSKLLQFITECTSERRHKNVIIRN